MKNKKLVSLLSLVLVVMFAVTGMGAIRIGKYNKDFDELWPMEIRFGDPKDKVVELYGDDYELMTALDGERTVMIYETSSGGEVIFRLDDDALISLETTSDSYSRSTLDAFCEKFGKPDKENKDLDMWFWYGKVHGDKCVLSMSIDPISKCYSVEYTVAGK